MKSRSKCLSCGEALRASDLVPVFSFLFLKGKCRYCRAPFGAEALIIEVMFGLLFTLLFHYILTGAPLVTALLWLAYYTLVFVSLGVIALYDLRHSYVPVDFLAMFSFLSLFMLGVQYVYEPSVAVLLGPLVVSLPFLLIWLITKGKALGFGDVLLFMAVGAFFGIEQGLAVLLVSVWLGAILGLIIYLLRRRRNNSNSAIPFVPFIVVAFLIILFTDMSIFSFAQFFA